MQLSIAVADAVGAIYEARALYDAENGIKDKSTIDLQAALALARKAEVVAVANLQAHIDAHHCRA